MEVRKYLIYDYFAGFPLHKPYPYSLYEDDSILGTNEMLGASSPFSQAES